MFIYIPPAPGHYHRFVFQTLDPGGAWVDQMDEVVGWCEEQFGPFIRDKGGEPRGWKRSAATFLFAKEDDAFAFRMRWC